MSIAAAALLILAAGSAGENTSQPSTAMPADAKEEADPMICQSDKVLGSRIKRKKICMRRTEWQRQHQEEKMMIDRTQVQRGCKPGG
ncbi:hypothetical protein [Novosphingobium sp.]|uniref:hypothetical protein n=1 Tax=Novosphingobium sp. TaxID=1874826 RepID=UPI00286AE46B|nr:hypothetical protein [Novosphingobium sp.]